MKNNSSLEIAYLLLTSKRPLSTKEITEYIGCDRKTVYSCIDKLEIAGFCTYVENYGRGIGNKYSLSLGE